MKDWIVRETPFTIIVNGKELVTLLCTAEKLPYLAIGYLVSSGLIQRKQEIKTMVPGPSGQYIHIELTGKIKWKENPGKRIIGSGCGKSISFYNLEDLKDCRPITTSMQIRAGKVINLMKEFAKKSRLFKKTGGVHAAALCDEKAIKIFAEDIGRHNAIDKVFGECLLRGIATQDKIILTSGRISSEILIKVHKRKVPLIISRGATTDLALNLARDLGITVVGFARGERMNIYTHPSRIKNCL